MFKKAISQISLAPLWATSAAIFLSFGWLLPNHSRPWSAFHSDAWVALVLAVVGMVVIVRSRVGFKWNISTLVLLAVTLLPFFQYSIGQLAFVGQAWISTAYLLGFLLAVLIGQQWDSWRPVWMGNLIFSAILIAAIASVGLQLQQWLELQRDGALNVWVLNLEGSRPYANMGQPNQLATLLLLGLLSCGWIILRRQIGLLSSLLSAAFLLLGLALTQSRTGALTLFIMLLIVWWKRNLWGYKFTHWYATGLFALYVALSSLLRPLSHFLMLSEPLSPAERMSQELRPAIWRMFLDAVLERPLAGYGWNEVLPAQLVVVQRHPPLNSFFTQSHNLFLDFVLWTGIPIGIFLISCCLVWLFIVARRVVRTEQYLYLLWILVIGIHAMFEYPLHYAYFLLPSGLIFGALNSGLKIGQIKLINHSSWLTGYRMQISMCFFSIILLGTIISDYLRVEYAYMALERENANIQNSEPAKPPKVLLLTHLREAHQFVKFTPKTEASEVELQWARDISKSVPSTNNLVKFAVLLGLNNKSAQAENILADICFISSKELCSAAAKKWKHEQIIHPQLKHLKGPALPG